jgi:hypothetical protein
MPSLVKGGDANGASDAPPPAYDACTNDESVANGRTPDDLRIPPTDDEISKVNLTEAFDKLSLDGRPKHPDVDTCLAHLKLLFAIQAMKEEVGYTDGLWNIWDARADSPETMSDGLDTAPPVEGSTAGVSNKKLAALSKIREKRWAVFLARAVDRYEAWWTSMQTPNGGLTASDMHNPTSENFAGFTTPSNDYITWDAANLPPLGKCSIAHQVS